MAAVQNNDPDKGKENTNSNESEKCISERCKELYSQLINTDHLALLDKVLHIFTNF